MNNTLLALVIGLAAGVCGAVVPGMLRGESTTTGAAGGAGPTNLSAVVERLDRIEEQLAASRPLLRGTGSTADPAAPVVTLPKLAAQDEAVLDAILARYDAHMREVVGEVMDERLEDIGPMSASTEVFEIPEKKHVTLAELAQELELTSFQEAELRRLSEQSMEKALALLATDEDGGVETVRRDLLEAKDNPEKATALVGKYMGRLIPNIGGFMMLEQEHKKQMKELLGEDKANRLENDYKVTDVDLYDLETVFTMGFGD